MSESITMTTAAALGEFRKELIDLGFSSEAAEELAVNAGREIVHESGLIVRNKTDKASE